MWPYDLLNANEIRNNSPNKEEENLPVDRYYQVQVYPKIRCHHTVGCPDYALNNHLQSGG